MQSNAGQRSLTLAFFILFFFFLACVWSFAFESSPVSSSSWLRCVIAPSSWRPHRVSTVNKAVFESRRTHLRRVKQTSELFILLGVFFVFFEALQCQHSITPPPFPVPPLSPSFQVAHCVGCWRTLVIIAADCCRGNPGLHILPGIPTQWNTLSRSSRGPVHGATRALYRQRVTHTPISRCRYYIPQLLSAFAWRFGGCFLGFFWLQVFI